MDETKVWKLMAKALAKEASSEELEQLQKLFNMYPEWGQTYYYLKNLNVKVKGNIHQEDLKRREAEGLQKIKHLFSIDPSEDFLPSKPTLWYQKSRTWGVAAAILLLVGIAGFFSLLQPNKGEKGSDLTESSQPKTYTALQATSIELADGSKVWLNQGSTLKCNKTFGNRNREVTLNGEAYFEVAASERHPFIVHLKTGINIKVLGTRFNIKSYSNTPFIEASLISGKIVLNISEQEKDRILMKPNEKVTIDVNKLGAVDQDSSTEKRAVYKNQIRLNPMDHKIPETAWMDNRLSFYDMTFEELSYELERIYDIKIIFKDKRLKEYHLTGSFREESLEQILKALQITTPFNYEVTGKEVILSNKNQ